MHVSKQTKINIVYISVANAAWRRKCVPESRNLIGSAHEHNVGDATISFSANCLQGTNLM